MFYLVDVGRITARQEETDLGSNYWAFGDQWAGITSAGKRFVVKTKALAASKAGVKSVPKSKKPKKKPKKGGKTTTTKNKGRRGARIVGNLGIKGLSVGSGLLALAKYLVRTNVPQAGAYTTAIANVGAGLVGKMVFGTGASLIQFGAVDGLSELIYDVATPGGAYDLPGIAPNARTRWDY